MSRSTKRFDVVVMGSGAAGLGAALSAGLGGARVCVLERAPVLGGTTAISGGGIWLPGTSAARSLGFDDSPEDVRRYLRQLTLGRTADRAIDAFVDGAPRVYAMLNGHAGLNFELTERPDYHTNVPGSKEGGRTMWPTTYDASGLGELLPLIRDTPHPGGIPPVTNTELEDSNWGIGERGDAWVRLVEARRAANVFTKGRALVAALVRACAEVGVEFRTGARVRELLHADRRVVGVLVEGSADAVEYLAGEGVVLASGGFEWNELMWRGFVGAPLDGPLSPPTNVGDAQQLAMRAGAQLAGTGEVWWMPGIDVGDEIYDGRPRLRMGAAGKSLPGAIVVNARGRRFANESMNYDDFGKYMASFDPHTFTYPNHPAFVIVDSRHRDRYPPVAYDASRHENARWLVEDATLGGLAGKLGIDPSGLEEQVKQFNRSAENGEDPQFLRGQLAHDRSGKFGDSSRAHANLAPLAEPPFYGYVLRASCLGTKGGAVTDEAGRVLDYLDRPIPGLFAAGNAAASVFASSYPGGGATIGAALVFGYAAGRALAGAGPIEPVAEEAGLRD